MANCSLVKVCVLGDSFVGKSSIATRYVLNTFDLDSTPTLGAAFISRIVSAPRGTLYKLQIWDTAGQERYKAMAPLYYRGASVVLIVYDITSYDSFNQGVRGWIKELKEKGSSDAKLILVGNKLDLASHDRRVEKSEAKAFAESVGAMFYESSAKTGQNIDNIFNDACNYLEQTKTQNTFNLSPIESDRKERRFITSQKPHSSHKPELDYRRTNLQRKDTVSLYTNSNANTPQIRKGWYATCCN